MGSKEYVADYFWHPTSSYLPCCSRRAFCLFRSSMSCWWVWFFRLMYWMYSVALSRICAREACFTECCQQQIIQLKLQIRIALDKYMHTWWDYCVLHQPPSLQLAITAPFVLRAKQDHEMDLTDKTCYNNVYCLHLYCLMQCRCYAYIFYHLCPLWIWCYDVQYVCVMLDGRCYSVAFKVKLLDIWFWFCIHLKTGNNRIPWNVLTGF